MSDVVIRAEGLGKKYLIGHEVERERYVALRDVISRTAKGFARAAQDMMRGSPIIVGDDVEEFWALKNINFEIKRGEVVGIIGRNGAGKSTLLKIISRITEPSEGRVTIKGRVSCLLEVGTGFHPELTGRENIFLNGAILGMTRAEIKCKFDEIVAFAEVERFLDTPVKRYSSGMYVRLAFAVAAHLEPEILVVDEVLAVGDAEFQRKCLGKIGEVAGHGRTVLFVSHNMSAVKRICRYGMILVDGHILNKANIDECIDAYLKSSVISQTGNVLEFSNRSVRDVYVTRIEMLDKDGNALPRPRTWGFAKFRIHFFSNKKVGNGSVQLYISTINGILLTRCSTRAESNQDVIFEVGENYIDCDFEPLLLSAGTFILGAGLAIPNVELLYADPHAAAFEVEGWDIFGSGRVPTASRYPVPMPHTWHPFGGRSPAAPMDFPAE